MCLIQTTYNHMHVTVQRQYQVLIEYANKKLANFGIIDDVSDVSALLSHQNKLQVNLEFGISLSHYSRDIKRNS
jgi:hypothetical protein